MLARRFIIPFIFLRKRICGRRDVRVSTLFYQKWFTTFNVFVVASLAEKIIILLPFLTLNKFILHLRLITMLN